MKEQKSLERSMSSTRSDSPYSGSIPLDLKDRVKERKKNVEENKGKGDKKAAMSLLKARREEKRERGMFNFNSINLSNSYNLSSSSWSLADITDNRLPKY